MVGASGFEPPTSWSRTRRSSQAEPRPDKRSKNDFKRNLKTSTALPGRASRAAMYDRGVASSQMNQLRFGDGGVLTDRPKNLFGNRSVQPHE